MSDDHPTQKGSLSSETSTNHISVNDDKLSGTRMDLERENSLTYNNLVYEAPAIYNRVSNERKNLMGFTDQLEYGNEAPMMYADIGNADTSPISYSRLRYARNQERILNSSGCNEGSLCDGIESISPNHLSNVGVVSSDSCEQVSNVTQTMIGLEPNFNNVETFSSPVHVDIRQGKHSYILERECIARDVIVEGTSNNIVDNATPTSVASELSIESSIGHVHRPKIIVIEDSPTSRQSNIIGTEDHRTESHCVSTNIKMNEGPLLVPSDASCSSCAAVVDMAVTPVECVADSASSDILSIDDIAITSTKCSEIGSANNLPRNIANLENVTEKASSSRSSFNNVCSRSNYPARSVVNNIVNNNVEQERINDSVLNNKPNPRLVSQAGPGNQPTCQHMKNQNMSTEPIVCPECIVDCESDNTTSTDFGDSKNSQADLSRVINAISDQVEKIISRQVAGEKLNKGFLAGDLAVLRECVPELYDFSCAKPYFRYMIDESLRSRGFLVHASHAMIFEAKERRNAFHNGPKKRLSAYADYIFVDDLEFVDTFHVQRQTLKPLFCCAREYPREALGTNEPVDKIVLLVLWYLSSDAPLTEAVKVFDLRSPQEVLQLLSTGFRIIEFMKRHVKLLWPNSKEIEEIALNIKRLYDFPNVMGLMAHFIFELENGRRTLVQAVCDHEYRFRDIYVSYNTRPEIAFQHSPLYRFLKKNKQLEGFHILSRNIVPSTNSCVLVPYEGDDLTHGGHICYNALHLSTTELIAKSMENVLSRFPRLAALHGSVDKPAIIAACVLHNFCILEQDLTPV